MSYRPPKNDVERLSNVLEGLAALPDDDEPTDEEIQAEAEASGIDFDAWAAEIRAKIDARREVEIEIERGEPEPDERSWLLQALAAQRHERARAGKPRWVPAALFTEVAAA
jgi:hypothetical protein